jgi:flagella basal body P-ring formation protein FlgA
MIGSLLIPAIMLAIVGGRCVPVSTDRIRAGDLAYAQPLFSSLDPDLPLGFTPLPGTRRVLSGREISVLANRYGLESNEAMASICVERASAPVSAGELKAVLEAALGIYGAHLELLDFSRQPLPLGRFEFQTNELSAPPAGKPEIPVIWRGRLLYDGLHSVAIWAKVRISMERAVIIATQNIAAGSEIRLEQIQAIRRTEFPLAPTAVDTPDKVIGKTLSRSIRAGQPIPAAAVVEPNEIAKGDKVQVRVMDGSAHIIFDALAVSGGRKGDTISLRNPANGRTFRGVIAEKGKAIVRLGGSA